MSRRFPRTVYFKIDFGAYVDDIFFHKLVSESYKPYLHFLSFLFYLFFFLQFIFAISHLKEKRPCSRGIKYSKMGLRIDRRLERPCHKPSAGVDRSE